MQIFLFLRFHTFMSTITYWHKRWSHLSVPYDDIYVTSVQMASSLMFSTNGLCTIAILLLLAETVTVIFSFLKWYYLVGLSESFNNALSFVLLIVCVFNGQFIVFANSIATSTPKNALLGGLECYCNILSTLEIAARLTCSFTFDPRSSWNM